MNNIISKFIGKDQKDKTIVKNVIYSFIIRALAIILGLVKMPMYIRYFNNSEVLGIWFTILSILTWIFNFDLGIGNGLRNKLVKPIEDNNNQEIKKYISSAYISIFVLVFFIGIIISTIIPIINWNKFFNTSTNYISNSVFIKGMFIILLGLLLQFLLKLINSIFYAYQKSYMPSMLAFISEVLLLIAILLLNPNKEISFKFYLIAILYTLCMSLPLLLSTFIMFSTKLKKSKPSIKFFSKKHAKLILTLGGLFFWIQIMYMIIVNTNEYLITWFVGPKYVVDYQIYYKLFSLIGTLFTLLLTPIWSMVTKAIVNKDYKWVNALYNRLKKLCLLAVTCELLLIPFLQILINIWLKDRAISVNYFYAILFAISGSLIIWNGVISTIVNGMGKLKVQFITLTSGVVLNIPLAYIFCNIFNGWIGVVLANIISFTPYCIIQPIYIKKMIKESI